jgi:hypothetical protein
MTFAEKSKWVVLPPAFLIGIGILEIRYPHVMSGFSDNYTGRESADLTLLLFELFLVLVWGRVGRFNDRICGITHNSGILLC